MVRNAGGRAMDAIRSIAVLQTIGGIGTLVVMHHTGKLSTSIRDGYLLGHARLIFAEDCGMTHYHDATVKKALLEFAPDAEELIEETKFGEITTS